MMLVLVGQQTTLTECRINQILSSLVVLANMYRGESIRFISGVASMEQMEQLFPTERQGPLMQLAQVRGDF